MASRTRRRGERSWGLVCGRVRDTSLESPLLTSRPVGGGGVGGGLLFVFHATI